MNNSINRKINVVKKINFQNDLSSTSSDFLSDYNKKKYIKQKGGNYSCSCSNMFKAISNNNLELILYILKENTCCFKCQNASGDTVLHELVPLYSSNDEMKEAFGQLLKQDCSSFINIQNNQGQTPILLAVMNDENELAAKLENAGADGSIEDVNGNFVESKEDSVEQVNGLMSPSDFSLDSEIIKKSSQNIINVYNIFVQTPQEQDLSSLNLTEFDNDVDRKDELEDKSDIKIDNSLNTDEFMKVVKDKINSSMGNNTYESSSSSSSSDDNTSTINTNKFIALLNDDKSVDVVSYSDGLDDTEQYIAYLRRKYDDPSGRNLTDSSDNPKKKITTDKQSKLEQTDTTSDMESSINTQMIKLENETTSDDLVPILNNKKKEQLLSDTSLPNEDISADKLNKLINETTSDVSAVAKSKPERKIESDTSNLEVPISSKQIEKYVDETTSENELGAQN